ncbi:MAG: LLM class flavin-dependent oxidoreductase [Chloroflexi bacterium]|nr:LLM class flavin-dependent oxidoreductase [Chloroflexota bacterium]
MSPMKRPFRFRHPVQVASEAATLAFLTDGRFELGLGPGRDDKDYASLGLADLKASACATGSTALRKTMAEATSKRAHPEGRRRSATRASA